MKLVLWSALLLSPLHSQTLDQPARAVTDPGVVTTRQTITPAGIPSVFQGRVYGVAFGATSPELWVLHASHVYHMDWRGNSVLHKLPHGGKPGLQGIQFDGETGRAVFSGVSKENQAVLRATDGQHATLIFQNEGTNLAGALALAPGKKVVVPLTFDNRLVVADLTSSGRVRSVPVGIAPFAAVVDRQGTTAWVSNWGGRRPTEKDLTAPTGLSPKADRVVVDPRGIASTGTVTRIDLNTDKPALQVAVGLHQMCIRDRRQ